MKIFKLAHNGERFTGAVAVDKLPSDSATMVVRGGIGTTATYYAPHPEIAEYGTYYCSYMGVWSDCEGPFLVIKEASGMEERLTRAGDFSFTKGFIPLVNGMDWLRHCGLRLEDVAPEEEWQDELSWRIKQERARAKEWFNDPDHNKE